MENKKTKKTDSRKTKPLKVKVLGLDGKVAATISAAKELFGLKLNETLVSQYIRVYLANKRHPSAGVKTRAEIKGSTRKIYRQKGTGRARHGSRKAPIFVGGGIAHGPKKRTYKQTINKKQRRQVFLQALSLQFCQNNIFVLSDDFVDLEAKTKNFASFLKKAAFVGQRIVLVLNIKENQNLYRAARNIKEVTIAQMGAINPYSILKADKLLFLKDSFKNLEKNEN